MNNARVRFMVVVSLLWLIGATSANARTESERDLFYKELAEYHAPAIFHDVNTSRTTAGDGDGGVGDLIRRFDFDGTAQNFEDNWEHVAQGDLKGYVYYEVTEDRDRYFVLFGVFHPRDFGSGTNAEPTRVKSKAIGPSDHNNDLEAALFVVRKTTGEQYGVLEGVFTLAHGDLHAYRDSSRLGDDVSGGFGSDISFRAGDQDGDVFFYGQEGRKRVALFIETGGHGIRDVDWAMDATTGAGYSFFSHSVLGLFESRGPFRFEGGDGIVYLPKSDCSTCREEPVIDDNGNLTADNVLSYELLPMSHWWDLVDETSQDTWQTDRFQYTGAFGVHISNLPQKLPTSWVSASQANPPWAFGQGAERTGDMYFDPQSLVRHANSLWISASSDYVCNQRLLGRNSVRTAAHLSLSSNGVLGGAIAVNVLASVQAGDTRPEFADIDIVDGFGSAMSIRSAVQLRAGSNTVPVSVPSFTGDLASATVRVHLREPNSSGGGATRPRYMHTSICTPMVDQGSGQDIVLCLDRSGSMRDGFYAPGVYYLRDAKQASNLLIGTMSNDDALGIVSFSYSASLNMPLQQLGGSGVRSAAENAVAGLRAGGGTGVGAGLQRSIAEIRTRGRSDTNHEIFLLTDGYENQSPSARSVISTLTPSDNIRVSAIALGSYADEALMQDIARATGGSYLVAHNPEELAGLYASLRGSSGGAQVVANNGAVLEAGQQSEVSGIVIGGGTTVASFGLTWPGSEFELVLTTPSGGIVDAAVAASMPDIDYREGPTHAVFEVRFPEVGTWSASVKAVSTRPGGEPYELVVQAADGLFAEALLPDTGVSFCENVPLALRITDHGAPVTGAQVNATVRLPYSGLTTQLLGPTLSEEESAATFPPTGVAPDLTLATADVQISLFDDGFHADGAADDGVYGAVFSGTVGVGSYLVRFEASGEALFSGSFGRVVSGAFLVDNSLGDAPSAGLFASPTSGAVPLDVAFSDQSTGCVEQLELDFGDGLSTTQLPTIHRYQNPGTYVAQLVVEGHGVTDTTTVSISVSDCPGVQITQGTSWDGVSLQEILDGEFGQGVIDASSDYFGYSCADPEIPYWLDAGIGLVMVREIAGFDSRNRLGWYTDGGQLPVIDGVDDGVIFDGRSSQGEVRVIEFPSGARRFGLYMNPNGDGDSPGAPEPEIFFTNPYFNDVGPAAAVDGLSRGDTQCLIFDVSELRGVPNTYIVAWEDIDAGLPNTPTYSPTTCDHDYQDMVVEVHAVSPVPAVVSNLAVGRVANGIRLGWSIEGLASLDRLELQRRRGDGEYSTVFSTDQPKPEGEWVDEEVDSRFGLRYRALVFAGGQVLVGEEVRVETDGLPSRGTGLVGAYPNPFNPMTTIAFDLAEKCRVDLRVFDIAGRLIRHFDLGERPAGRGTVAWDGRAEDGRRVASGVYAIRLDADGHTSQRRVVLLK